MVDARLPGINKVRKRLADGTVKVYFYHRATGIRLPGIPGSAAFVTSYAEAAKQVVPPPRLDRLAGTCSSLIRSFILSGEFTGLAASTQSEYRRLLTVVDRKFGQAPLAAIADPRFAGDALAWRDEIAAAKPREADNRMVIFRRLLSWGMERRILSTNVLEGYRRIHRSDRSDKLWLAEHIAAIETVASDEMRGIFLVALHTGLRQGDIRRLSWSAYDGSALSVRISKRRKGSAGTLLRIPCTSALRALLDDLPRRGPLIFSTTSGRAWQKRYLARRFEETRAAAATIEPSVMELHFHDTRGTAITMLAEAGATVAEIAAITGHSFRTVTTILERYLPRTRHLAEQAIAKVENRMATFPANRAANRDPA